MKVLVDTNIFVAGMRFSGVKRKLVWKLLEEGHTVVLTDFIVEELRRKFSEMYGPEEAQAALDNFLQFLGTGSLEVKTYEDYAPHLEEAEQLIREKDAPILAATMLSDIDHLLTRDKQDFLENERLRETPWMAKIKDPQELLALLEGEGKEGEITSSGA
jgi:predicted nucleic acid-binding protein